MMQKKNVVLPNIVNMLKDIDTYFKKCNLKIDLK